MSNNFTYDELVHVKDVTEETGRHCREKPDNYHSHKLFLMRDSEIQIHLNFT